MHHSFTAIAGSGSAMMLALLATACGIQTRLSSDPALRANECALPSSADLKTDAVTIALTDRVDPAHAPHPQNDSERILFRTFYETLIRVDCKGRPYRGLAEAWVADEGGRRWTFTLREGAAFWDGAPVKASHVVSSWLAESSSGRLRTAGVHFVSVSALNDRTLQVMLREPREGVPRVFADPALAVAARSTPTNWPEGSGPYRLIGHAHSTGETLPEHFLSGEPVVASPGAPAIRFQLASGVDPRDVLDGGVDLLVTRDPSVLDYAATRSQFGMSPLPWSRTYVLLAPRSRWAASLDSEGATDEELAPSSFRETLARDAVRSEARGATPPFWWNDLGACKLGAQISAMGGSSESDGETRSSLTTETDGSDADAISRSGRIVYIRGDTEARELAERIVAVQLLGPNSRLTAAGLGRAEFAAALRSGDESGFVLSLPREPVDSCQQAQALMVAAEWLPPDAVGLAQSVVPLVDTRSHAIVRRGLTGAMVDGDGTVFLSGADWDDR